MGWPGWSNLKPLKAEINYKIFVNGEILHNLFLLFWIVYERYGYDLKNIFYYHDK